MPRLSLSFVLLLSLLAVAASVYSQETGEWGYIQRAKEAHAKGQHDKCLKDLDEAIRLNPNSAAAYSMRGEIWLAEKRDFDKAIADFNRVLRIDPRDATVYGYRGFAWDQKGEHDKAIADFDQVLRLRPDDINAYGNRALNRSHKGQYDKAIADFTRMIWLVANEATTHVLHSATWAAEGEYGPARDELQQALELQQVLAAAFASRGYVWDTKGDYGKALDDFNLAVRIQPKYAECQNGLAWILATCPDERYRNGKDALRFATQACQLDGGKIASHFDTLAAAYAETGDFDKAQKWQAKAIATNAEEQHKQEYQSRLKLYQQHKPYRDVQKVSGR